VTARTPDPAAGSGVRPLAVVGALGVLAALVALRLGVVPVGWRAVVDALLGFGRDAADLAPQAALVRDVRLPRAVGAYAVGACLGAAGAVLQATLRNPLASPAVVGTSQAAGLGAAVALLVGAGELGVLGASFAVAATAMAALTTFVRRAAGRSDTLVLAGVGIGFLCAGATNLLRTFTRDEAAAARLGAWALGGLWHASWRGLAVAVPVGLAAVAAAIVAARRLDVLALGDEDAERLGLAAARNTALFLGLAAAASAAATCVGGLVPFVGLVVPHLARRCGPLRHRVVVPLSALLGGLLVLVADTAARTCAAPRDLPLGAVTATLGAPGLFVILASLARRSSP
jgi:iron complex transport system permease protein